MMTLEALGETLRARDLEITQLINADPSIDLFRRLDAALAAGEILRLKVQALKQQLTFESGRLAQVRAGLVSGLGCAPDPHIEVRG